MEINDFALYAKKARRTIGEGMITPEPVAYAKKSCELRQSVMEPISGIKKPSTAEELKHALAAMRLEYEKFLLDFAPQNQPTRTVVAVKEFELDGKYITLPHYGGPIGPAVKHYKAEFALPEFGNNSVFFCCGGADYIATVYVNGRCAGIHEGFFSSFEFDITRYAKSGKNLLEIVLENDYPFRGGTKEWDPENVAVQGDKVYAATGMGFDDSKLGWRACPPGMGLYHSVSIEIRNPVHITDLYVRPNLPEQEAELWIEVENRVHDLKKIQLGISLFGQNFEEVIFENQIINPLFMEKPLELQYGKHIYKVPVKIPNPRVWALDSPWLYQAQVSVIYKNHVCDVVSQQFGMRSFEQDVTSTRKGMFYLNGEPIRLRGANTMGFEQQDVMREDFDQLVDDILLAKLCNMNFWRITQRPVQNEVYQYCDKLGFMTQCDFPLFGVLRRTKGIDCAKQVEEMVRLVRKHPCHTVITYINERWSNANGQPHRHMLHDEMEDWFEIFDRIVRYNFPDCVIKHVDGDFDPPTRHTMPDVHCYTLWYSGGQQDFGLLHRGYGQNVAAGWFYGCGEYGAEGLDYPEVMIQDYPKEWSREPFDPGNIPGAQAKEWHGNFFETPESMEQWSIATQKHQAYAMKMMTEAYRRDPRIVSSAVHLFIDAFPASWMKTIMDHRRTPKAAYFATRDALSPLLVSLRSDRFTYYAGEKVSIETYICNDTNNVADDTLKLVFQLYRNGSMYMCGETPAVYSACDVSYLTNVDFSLPEDKERT